MSEEDLANGIIFPPLSKIRHISKEVGVLAGPLLSLVFRLHLHSTLPPQGACVSWLAPAPCWGVRLCLAPHRLPIPRQPHLMPVEFHLLDVYSLEKGANTPTRG